MTSAEEFDYIPTPAQKGGTIPDVRSGDGSASGATIHTASGARLAHPHTVDERIRTAYDSRSVLASPQTQCGLQLRMLFHHHITDDVVMEEHPELQSTDDVVMEAHPKLQSTLRLGRG